MIKYNIIDDPTISGVYACRVPDEQHPEVLLLAEDKFLFWANTNKQWYHRGSDQKYRGEVLGWIGPLQRKL